MNYGMYNKYDYGSVYSQQAKPQQNLNLAQQPNYYNQTPNHGYNNQYQNYGQSYAPLHQQQFAQSFTQVPQQSTSQEQKTLWIGDIEPWMDENYLKTQFTPIAFVVSVKLIRDKTSNIPTGYGFIEFQTNEIARHILNTKNGVPLSSTTKGFKLNWGVQGGGSKQQTMQNYQKQIIPQQQKQIPQAQPLNKPSFEKIYNDESEHSIYVSDMDANTTEQDLKNHFQKRYSSIIGVKIITDPLTGVAKGYGFVKFTNPDESQRALVEMNGSILMNKQIKVSQSFSKNPLYKGLDFSIIQNYSQFQQQVQVKPIQQPPPPLFLNNYAQSYDKFGQKVPGLPFEQIPQNIIQPNTPQQFLLKFPTIQNNQSLVQEQSKNLPNLSQKLPVNSNQKIDLNEMLQNDNILIQESGFRQTNKIENLIRQKEIDAQNKKFIKNDQNLNKLLEKYSSLVQ